MSSLEEDKRLHSIDYLLQSCALVKALGGRRVIFHSGSCGMQSVKPRWKRRWIPCAAPWRPSTPPATATASSAPKRWARSTSSARLDEVLALCSVDERITPCIDFGHLYARSQGTEFAGDHAAADYAALLDKLQVLGPVRAAQFHAHFSRIAYTKGGENAT